MNAAPARAQRFTIGIDYSSQSVALAVVDGRSVLRCGEDRLGADADVQIATLARLVQDLHGEPGVCPIWMEQPWARAEAGIQSALQVHRRAYWIEALATAASFPVHFVQVPTWHAAILGKGNMRSAAGKRASMRYVQLVYGLQAPSHNVADAIGIATYGHSVAAMAGRVA